MNDGWRRITDWIQHNGTEMNVAEELVKLGVPKEHIVLGFQPVPYDETVRAEFSGEDVFDGACHSDWYG